MGRENKLIIESDCELDQTSLAVKLRERSLVCLTVWTWLAEQYKSKWLAALSCLSRLIMRQKMKSNWATVSINLIKNVWLAKRTTYIWLAVLLNYHACRANKLNLCDWLCLHTCHAWPNEEWLITMVTDCRYDKMMQKLISLTGSTIKLNDWLCYHACHAWSKHKTMNSNCLTVWMYFIKICATGWTNWIYVTGCVFIPVIPGQMKNG